MKEDDVRNMVRLIGEVVAIPGNHAEKKRFLMEGLCGLIGADAWAWALSCQRDPGKPQVYASVLNGGLSDENLVKLLQAIEHPEMVAMTAKFFGEVEARKAHLTRPVQSVGGQPGVESSGAGARDHVASTAG